MKKIKLEIEEGVPSIVIQEISLLKELCYPNIVSIQDIQDSRLYLIFEFFPMDLKKYLDSLPPDQFMDFPLIKNNLYQILQVTLQEFCHSRRVLHRDFKPQNPLIDDKGTIKLADLGLARHFRIPVRMYTYDVVAIWYRFSEVQLAFQHHLSFGLTKYEELATKKSLFFGDSETHQLFRIFGTLSTASNELWP
ncbi:LOW QUALITY PROTEIN: Cyclin-dependent kinase 1, partial [Galemys pyrenaicus]